MITITRCLARHLRAVFRRALRLSCRDAGPLILFAAGADGMRIQARNASAAVEYSTAGQFPAEQISAPFVFLSDCEGTRAEPVTLGQDGDSKTVAQWSDKKIPQLVNYEIKPGTIPVFPVLPAAMAENDARLWRVMADAMETVDCDTVRFATDCVQLRSDGGRVVATDGQQLLVQKGFSFPWDGDLLIPHNSLFACKELPLDGSLRIGRSEDWLTLQAGPWTFHLAIDKDRRFPKTEDFVLRPDAALTRLQLAEGDAAFLADALQRLPCDEDDLYHAVTVDINGHVIVRARGGDSKVPTELVLTRSSSSGENLRFVTNRNYLARAVKLGFRDVCVFGTESPVQAFSDDRAYIWAPLGEDGAIKPNGKAVRINSDDSQQQQEPCSSEPSPPIRRTTTMSKSTRFQTTPSDETESVSGSSNGNGSSSNGNGNGSSNGNGQADAAGSVDAIERAEALRTTLRTALGQVSELISTLKQQKKTNKTFQSALATLRQLEKVAR